MQKHVHKSFLIFLVLSACSTANHKTAQERTTNSNTLATTVSPFDSTDSTWIHQPGLPAGTRAVSLTELPRTEEGAFVFSPGLYETDFKTYCLQPGTPGPTNQDAYFQAPLSHAKKDQIGRATCR